jgi:hypothetical protein
MDENSINRRNCLKALGAASAGTAVLSGNAMAADSIKSAKDQIEELSGKDKERIVKKAQLTEEFKYLKKVATNHDLIDDEAEIAESKVFTLTDKQVKTAVFFLESPDHLQAKLDVPITDLDKSNAVVMTTQGEQSNKVTPQLTYYSFTELRDADELKALGESKEIKSGSKSVYRNDLVVNGATKDVEIPDFGVSFDGCSVCKDFVGAVNTLGCGLSGVVACATLTAQTAVGPLACGGLYALVCFGFLQLSLAGAEDVCTREDLNAGNPPC